jgi:hypothetical protein
MGNTLWLSSLTDDQKADLNKLSALESNQIDNLINIAKGTSCPSICQGQTGPAGPAGPKGDPGPAGPTGSVTYEGLTSTDLRPILTSIIAKTTDINADGTIGLGHTHLSDVDKVLSNITYTESTSSNPSIWNFNGQIKAVNASFGNTTSNVTLGLNNSIPDIQFTTGGTVTSMYNVLWSDSNGLFSKTHGLSYSSTITSTENSGWTFHDNLSVLKDGGVFYIGNATDKGTVSIGTGAGPNPVLSTSVSDAQYLPHYGWMKMAYGGNFKFGNLQAWSGYDSSFNKNF